MFTSTFYAAIGLLTVSKQLYAGVYTAVESAKQLGGFFEFSELPEEVACSIYAGESVNTIRFKNVGFAYPEAEAPVLKGVNLCYLA